MVGGADAGEQFACFVAGRACPLGGGVGDRGRLRAVPIGDGHGEVELEHDGEAGRPGQLERPLEQPRGGAVVAAPGCAAAGGREPLAGAVGQGRVGLSELLLVAGGLLEVVAEDLVQLDQLLCALLQPGGEALVQLRPGGFGEGVVGGVADQQVAEAEAVLACELRLVGSDQLPADERGQAWRHLRLLRCERLHGAAVEDLALDRAPLEHPPLARVELVEAGGEQRPQARRHLDPGSRLGGHRQHLTDEERVAAGRSGDPHPQLLRHSRSDQAGRLLAAERLQPHRHRPGGAALEQLRAGDADDQQRSAAGEQHDMLDQVEERLLAPLDVVEDKDERRLLLEQLAERPGDLLRRRPRLRLP